MYTKVQIQEEWHDFKANYCNLLIKYMFLCMLLYLIFFISKFISINILYLSYGTTAEV